MVANLPGGQPEEDGAELTIRPLGPARGRSAPVRERPARAPRRAESQQEVHTTPRVPPRLLDRDAVEVVRRLRRNEHAAYIVGGCVRDLLVGLPPKDFDVATSARPEEVRKIFRNSRIIGRRFRLVHIYFRGGKIIETSTFRGSAPVPEVDEDDDEPQDLLITRDNVWGTEEEDALRRDFTINALFYDVSRSGIIDHVGGLPDMEAGRIRTVGEPDRRVQEDPVRILRAVRFAAKLDFAIEEELGAAMERHKMEIARCASPRVLEETFKLLRGGHSERALAVLRQSRVLDAVIPELVGHDEPAEDEEAVGPADYLRALDGLVARRGSVTDAVVLAAVFHAVLDARLEDVESSDHVRATVECLDGVCQRLGVTRRNRERLRQIFTAQKHFRRVRGERRPRRQVSPQALLRRSYFVDALDLFEIWTNAHGKPVDEVKVWRQRAGDLDEPGDDVEPEPRDPKADDERGPRKKPSRRRPRRRRPRARPKAPSP